MLSKEAIAQGLVKRHKELKSLMSEPDSPQDYGQDSKIFELLEELQAHVDAPANAALARASQYEQQARESAALESMKVRR